jgi:hypothetical protein
MGSWSAQSPASAGTARSTDSDRSPSANARTEMLSIAAPPASATTRPPTRKELLASVVVPSPLSVCAPSGVTVRSPSAAAVTRAPVVSPSAVYGAAGKPVPEKVTV